MALLAGPKLAIVEIDRGDTGYQRGDAVLAQRHDRRRQTSSRTGLVGRIALGDGMEELELGGVERLPTSP